MWFGSGWWLGKTLEELKALLPTLTKEDEIEECKKRIAELEKDEHKEEE